MDIAGYPVIRRQAAAPDVRRPPRHAAGAVGVYHHHAERLDSVYQSHRRRPRPRLTLRAASIAAVVVGGALIVGAVALLTVLYL